MIIRILIIIWFSRKFYDQNWTEASLIGCVLTLVSSNKLIMYFLMHFLININICFPWESCNRLQHVDNKLSSLSNCCFWCVSFSLKGHTKKFKMTSLAWPGLASVLAWPGQIIWLPWPGNFNIGSLNNFLSIFLFLKIMWLNLSYIISSIKLMSLFNQCAKV